MLLNKVFEEFEPDRITLGTPRINNALMWKLPIWKLMRPLMEHISRSKWRLDRRVSARTTHV